MEPSTNHPSAPASWQERTITDPFFTKTIYFLPKLHRSRPQIPRESPVPTHNPSLNLIYQAEPTHQIISHPRWLQTHPIPNFNFRSLLVNPNTERTSPQIGDTHILRSHKHCIPGPKSGRARIPKHYIVPLYLLLSSSVTSMDTEIWHGGEGCSDMSWIRTEADFDADDLDRLLQAKVHDQTLQIGYGHRERFSCNQVLTGLHKRSLQRAFKRAQQAGCAWYKGKCFTPGQFLHRMQQQSLPSCASKPKSGQTHRFAPRHGPQVGHVNVGGLSKERLMEIKLRAIDVELDILVLSETRWCFKSERQDPLWYHLHSGQRQIRWLALLDKTTALSC